MKQPVCHRNVNDAPREVAVHATALPPAHRIPFHIHRRGQLLHTVCGVLRVDTAQAARMVPPARGALAATAMAA